MKRIIQSIPILKCIGLVGLDTMVSKLTHVSIAVDDLKEAVAFYTDLLGLEPLQTPDFGEQEDVDGPNTNSEFLRCDDQQFHLFVEPESEPMLYSHVAIHVDNFEEVYREAKKLDIFAALGDLREQPRIFQIDTNAQMYVRDPSNNLIEINYPEISELDEEVFDRIIHRDIAGPEIGVYMTEKLK